MNPGLLRKDHRLSTLAMALPHAKCIRHSQIFANIAVKCSLLHKSHNKYQSAFTDIDILKILQNISYNMAEEVALDIDSRTARLVQVKLNLYLARNESI